MGLELYLLSSFTYTIIITMYCSSLVLPVNGKCFIRCLARSFCALGKLNVPRDLVILSLTMQSSWYSLCLCLWFRLYSSSCSVVHISLTSLVSYFCSKY